MEYQSLFVVFTNICVNNFDKFFKICCTIYGNIRNCFIDIKIPSSTEIH